MAIVNTVLTESDKQKMHERIKLLSDEIDANEEENRAMQTEIDGLYKKIDAEGGQ